MIRLLLGVASHADLFFRLAVPRLQIVILDRPIGKATVTRFHFKIGRHKAQAGPQPMPCRSAIDALIRASESQRAVLNEIALLWILPVTECAPGAETEYGRSAGIDGRWIREFAAME